MKLRIAHNSIRFRLGQSEVRHLAAAGSIEQVIHLGPGPEQRLAYALQTAPPGQHDAIAHFCPNRLTVLIPRDTIERWARSDETSIESHQRVGDCQELQILIEKDLECTQPQREDNPDAFPRPRSESST